MTAVDVERRRRLFQELTEAHGAPGFEHQVREIMRSYLTPLCDEVVTDRLGSIAGKKAGDPTGPKVLMAGHMDEVAFMVSRVTDEGFLHFRTLGGWWEQVMLAQRVRIHTRTGESIVGVIGSKPPHILSAEERKKPVEKDEMFIDVGASSRDEVSSFGIRPGDMVTPESTFTVMRNEKFLLAKAWDNRIGCALAVELLRELQQQSHPNVVYAGATVQEEVGLRGAQTLSEVVSPDVAIALDVGIAGDTPGVKADKAQARLGGGPQILLYDASMIPHGALRDLCIAVAEEEGIPYQFDAMAGGGTDAGRFHLHGSGVPSVVLSIPTRYIHSHASILHEDDFTATLRLLVALVRRLDWKTLQQWQTG